MKLSQKDWKDQIKTESDVFILDVRTAEEYEDKHIPSAINIDIYLGQEFIYELEQLDKSKNYYVYCRSGNRSEQACILMSQMGFKVYNLEGGINDWEGETVES